MSILIKGMQMPTSCYYCGLTDTSFINCQAFSQFRLLEDDCEERKPEWCPLVELPEHHGRLVDADYLEKHAGEWLSTYNLIDSAETIIDAE